MSERGARDSARPPLHTQRHDLRALVAEEQRIAATGRSGVRAVAPEVQDLRRPPLDEPSPVAPAQAEAPAIEITHEDVAADLDGSPSWSPGAPHDRMSHEPFFDAPPATSSLPPRRSSTTPPASHRGGRLRRFFAGVLFVVVMALALGLLANALEHRGIIHVPASVDREILRLIHDHLR